MKITDYDFGRISIDGCTYTSDVIISPESVIDNWWRKEGHSLHIEDLQDIVDAKPDLLIIGTGYYGRMSIPDKTMQYLKQQGMEVKEASTTDAVSEFNRLQQQYARIVAALHLTC